MLELPPLGAQHQNMHRGECGGRGIGSSIERRDGRRGHGEGTGRREAEL